MSLDDVLQGRQQWAIECADVRAGLALLPDDSVHMVATSPPYWGLRAYGTTPQVWDDGARDFCQHEWGPFEPGDKRGGSGPNAKEAYAGDGKTTYARGTPRGQFCQICGAWLGELGSEPDPMLFVKHLVDVFREVRRVLRPDGTLWLNMGSSYVSTAPGTLNAPQPKGSRTAPEEWANYRPPTPDGFKPKDLIMTPFFVAEALRQDGWWLRQVLIWDKPACMPESVTDRCTTSHEYIFLLSKSRNYSFDADAIRESNSSDEQLVHNQRYARSYEAYDSHASETGQPGNVNNVGIHARGGIVGRNKRSVWRVTSEPLKAEHFAAYPTQLVEPMIMAGTSAHGCCGACGAPWRRVVERSGGTYAERRSLGIGGPYNGKPELRRTAGTVGQSETIDLGWEPSCKCPLSEPVPAIVLDPFCGSGTTIIEALRHGRRAIGLELNPEYVDMARRRIVADAPMFNEVAL